MAAPAGVGAAAAMGVGAITKAAANGLSCAVEEAYSEKTLQEHGRATQHNTACDWILDSAFVAAGAGVGGGAAALAGAAGTGAAGSGLGKAGCVGVGKAAGNLAHVAPKQILKDSKQKLKEEAKMKGA